MSTTLWALALTDTLFNLPESSRLVVAAMAVASFVLILNSVTNFESDNLVWVVLATVGGFFLVDLFYIHPVVWSNVPALFYWLAKPFWVGVPMFLTAMALMRWTDIPTVTMLVIAGIVGVVVLQLYYTVIPIPVVGGEAIQIGLVGNLTEGVGIHGGGLLLSLAAVLFAMWVVE